MWERLSLTPVAAMGEISVADQDLNQGTRCTRVVDLPEKGGILPWPL